MVSNKKRLKQEYQKSKLINRLALHAYKLELANPVTKKLLTFEINMPKSNPPR